MNTFNWESIGPYSIDASSGATSGQVRAIAFSPNIDGAGTGALLIGTRGGMWRSLDWHSPAPTWTALTDGRLDMQEARSIIVDQTDPRTIYVAAQFAVHRSRDGGDTFPEAWRQSLWVPDSSFLKIFQHPATNEIFGVTQLVGLHRWDGTAWQTVGTGLPSGGFVFDADVVVDAAGNTTFYAVVCDPSNASVGGVWQCITTAGKWTQMTTSLVNIAGDVVTNDHINNAVFASDRSPGSAGGIFLAVAEAIPGTKGFSEYNDAPFINVFTLSNGTWMPVGTGIDNRFNTFSALAMGMNADGRLYLGAVNSWSHGLFQSDPGGSGWKSIDYDKDTGEKPHTDFWIWFFVSGEVYAGCDGGIYRFVPRRDGRTGPGNWVSLNAPTLRTSLSQGVSHHPRDGGVWLAGCQDETMLRCDASGAWASTTGMDGDTGNVAFAVTAANRVVAYATGMSNFSFFFRSDDNGKTFADMSPTDAKRDGLDVPDNAPFAVHPSDGARVAVGVDRVFESKDAGISWRLVIPSDGSGAKVGAVAYGGGESIWVAIGKTVFNSLNGGGDGSASNWISGDAPSADTVLGLCCDPRTPDVAYGVTGSHVFRFERSGGAVIAGDLTGGTTPGRFIRTIAVRPGDGTDPPTLFIGTAAGVFGSFNGPGATGWGLMNRGLPATDVKALEYSARYSSLAAASYGRGAWVAALDVFETPVVTIVPPSRNSCGDRVDANGAVTFTSQVSNPLFSDPFTYQWIVKHGHFAAGETGMGPTCAIVLPALGQIVHVSLVVTFQSGFVVTAELGYVGVDPQVGRLLDLVCRLRLEAIPVRFFDPLWDPLRAILSTTPLDRKQLGAAAKVLDQLSRIVSNALQSEGR